MTRRISYISTNKQDCNLIGINITTLKYRKAGAGGGMGQRYFGNIGLWGCISNNKTQNIFKDLCYLFPARILFITNAKRITTHRPLGFGDLSIRIFLQVQKMQYRKQKCNVVSNSLLVYCLRFSFVVCKT